MRRAEALLNWKVAQENLNKLLGAERVLLLHGLINESLELLSPADASPGADDDECTAAAGRKECRRLAGVECERGMRWRLPNLLGFKSKDSLSA